jgi:uncharacterized protein with HEPN domain
MTLHNDRVTIEQMLDYGREAVAYTANRSVVDLESDRLLEMVGEAARRVSDDLRLRHPEVAWSQIIGLRNRLIHGYDTIDNQILWQIINNDLPDLIVKLELILASGS